MGNFNRDNRDGNKRGFRRRGFGGRRMDRQMHKTICSECGNECEVPFKPTGDKPVFCSSCFEKRGPAEPRRYNDRDSRRSNRSDRQRYRVVRDSGSGNKNTEQFKEQFDKLNAKLDQVLKALTPVSPIKAAPMGENPPKPKKAAKKRASKKNN